jgi:hypothetical protein
MVDAVEDYGLAMRWAAFWMGKVRMVCSLFVWLVLICSERKVLLAGCWWLVACERKVPLAGG